ncbi:MAG TPA: serine/threonine-protein kinase [Gemmatimonadaceae bacterium]|nr:serine/threonine-protein kinase [Gemmatimonadaceae bacterium]
MTPAPLIAALSDRYRIQRELGAGGMATVYLAEDLKHHRPVAIKVLHPDIANTIGPERFLREIEIAAGLHHPHILPLYDSGEAAGFLFYVMPYVEGESLGRKLAREGELPVADAVRILRDVADALAKAHAQGLVHRDIKPDNVLLADRHALVADFGVARAVSQAAAGTTLTSVGVALGTPAYMAPEQAAADPNVDHRADIYAFGCLGYEMLTGAPPFTGHGAPQVLAAHMTTAPVRVTQHRAAVPEPLAQLVMRCLEKKPADRWQSAAELVTQLETMLTPGSGTAATRAQLAASIPAARKPLGRWVAAAAVAALVVAGGWFAISRLGTRQASLDPNLVVIPPFRVTGGDAQVAVLREGMLDLMATYLTGEGGTLRAADPGTVMAAWRRHVRSESEDLSEDQARAMARELGAGRLLTGSVVASGGQILIRGALTRLDQNTTPVQASVEGHADSLVALLPRFVGQVLAQSTGVTSDASSGLTTSSLPALRAYLMGQSEYRHGRYSVAVNRYTEALENDSTFALAGVGLLTAHGWTGSASDRIADLARRAAWNGRSELSVRDRALVAAALGPGGLAPAPRRDFLRAREEFTALAGDRADAWYYLGDEYFHQGAVLGIDDAMMRAESALERAVALDSSVSGPIEHLLLIAALQGDTAKLRSRLALYERTADSIAYARHAWMTSTLLGDSAAATRSLETMIRTADDNRVLLGGPQMLLPFMPEHAAAVHEAALRLRNRAHEAYRGQTAFELALLEWDLGRPESAARRVPGLDDPDLVATKILAALFWSGDTTEAAAGARRLAGAGGGATEAAWIASPACALAMWYANRGEQREAERATARLRQAHAQRDPSLPPDRNQVCASIVEAMRAQAQQRPNAAEILNTLERTLLSVPYRPLSWENLALATLLENQGEYARAAAAARRHQFLFGPSLFYAAHLRQSGRLAERAGDMDRAIEAYTKYLALRHDPEPSVAPEVAQVRRDLERLTSERPPARK